jgi:hypothetical protein
MEMFFRCVLLHYGGNFLNKILKITLSSPPEDLTHPPLTRAFKVSERNENTMILQARKAGS